MKRQRCYNESKQSNRHCNRQQQQKQQLEHQEKIPQYPIEQTIDNDIMMKQQKQLECQGKKPEGTLSLPLKDDYLRKGERTGRNQRQKWSSSSSSSLSLSCGYPARLRKSFAFILFYSCFSIMLFFTTFWNTYYHSHSIQQLMLESRHPLSMKYHHNKKQLKHRQKQQLQQQQQKQQQQHPQQPQNQQQQLQQTPITTSNSRKEESVYSYYYNYDDATYSRRRRMSSSFSSGTVAVVPQQPQSNFAQDRSWKMSIDDDVEALSYHHDSDIKNDAGMMKHATSNYDNEANKNDALSPLSRKQPHHHQRQKQEESTNYDDKISTTSLRVLSFGSSSTWGQGLSMGVSLEEQVSNEKVSNNDESKFPSSSKQQRQAVPYPYLLDKNAFNAAIPYHASNDAALLFAACTQSIVGDDDSFNVVTIEYYNQFQRNHMLLVQRIRQRFPMASIVLIQILDPLDHLHTTIKNTRDAVVNATGNSDPDASYDNMIDDDTNHNNDVLYNITLGEWLQRGMHLSYINKSKDSTQSNIINDDDDDLAYIHEKLSTVMMETHTWSFAPPRHMSTNHEDYHPNDLLKQTLDMDDNIHYYTLPLPSTSVTATVTSEDSLSRFFKSFDMTQLLRAAARSFRNGRGARSMMSSILSAFGHRQIAHDVRAMLLLLSTSSKLTPLSRHDSPSLYQSSVIRRRSSDTTLSTAGGNTNNLLSTRYQYHKYYSKMHNVVLGLRNNHHHRTKVLMNDDRANLLGSWGSGDDCHIWFDTGRYDLHTNAKQVDLYYALSLNPDHHDASTTKVATTNSFTTTTQLPSTSTWLHKHVLEFYDNETITIRNQFVTDRIVYLTYLTDDDNSYPRTRILLNGIPSVIIEPYQDDVSPSTDSSPLSSSSDSDQQRRPRRRRHHFTRTTAVGYITANTQTIIQFDILQPNSVYPFRLVGASLLANEVIHADHRNNDDEVNIEFSLEREWIM